MRAAVVRKSGEPLVIEDRPVPVPGRGQITIRMQASGLCHTDIHAANGDWPVKPTPPFVPGHEGVGTVHAVAVPNGRIPTSVPVMPAKIISSHALTKKTGGPAG
jgi:D-arabinose 1-dehydrogenase-like Zn-dependent alcohol dehydrogenase